MRNTPSIDDVAEMCYTKGRDDGYEKGYNDKQYGFFSLLSFFIMGVFFGGITYAILYPVMFDLIK